MKTSDDPIELGMSTAIPNYETWGVKPLVKSCCCPGVQPNGDHIVNAGCIFHGVRSRYVGDSRKSNEHDERGR